LKLRDGVFFGIPPSQFPILLSPNESISVDICYDPSTLGTFNDLLVLPDTCWDHILEIMGETIQEEIEGLTRCNIPWTGEIINLPKSPFFFSASKVFPNPFSSISQIQFIEFASKEKDIDYELQILNSMGEIVTKVKAEYAITEQFEESKLIEGSWNINLENHSNGAYFVKLPNGELRSMILSK